MSKKSTSNVLYYKQANKSSLVDMQVKLSDTLTFSPDLLIGSGVAAFGVPGAGKTNVGALLLEQLGKFYIPMAVFDVEHEYTSLPNVLPRCIIATPQNCPTGKMILDHGLQVVFDLQAWPDPETQAELICTTIAGMMQWADERPTSERVPAVIFVDEASYWLPERRGTYLEKETFKLLLDTFGQLGSRGRKRGLTPILLNQRISTLSKSILGYIQCYILMKQSLDTDLERYLEYIHGDLTARQIKTRVAAFKMGRAIVKLPDGRQITTTFHERTSEHVSHTPTVESAMNKYAAMPFDASMFQPTPPYPTVTVTAKKRVTVTTTKLCLTGMVAKRVRQAYAENPNITPAKLAQKARCPKTQSAQWLKQMKLENGN